MFKRNLRLAPAAWNEAHKRDERPAMIGQLLQREANDVGLCLEKEEQSLSYPYVPVIKILGLRLDGELAFTEHIDTTIGKAKVRHGIMAQLASTA